MMKNIFKTFLIVLVILGSVTAIVKQNDITTTNNLNRYNNTKQKFSDEWDYCHMQPDNIIKACLDSSYIGVGHVSDWMVFNKTAWYASNWGYVNIACTLLLDNGLYPTNPITNDFFQINNQSYITIKAGL